MRTRRVGEVLRGLGTLLEQLESSPRTPVKGVYGFTVRTASGEPLIERSGTVDGPERSRTEKDVRVPQVDVFDEADHFRVVAEIPGVERDDVRCEIRADGVRIEAARGSRLYLKEITLPAGVDAGAGTWSHRNGILEIKLPKSS